MQNRCILFMGRSAVRPDGSSKNRAKKIRIKHACMDIGHDVNPGCRNQISIYPIWNSLEGDGAFLRVRNGIREVNTLD
jgi:hypothetical protein